MREVSIYIVTSIQGRWNRNGYIAYCLEYYQKGNKYPSTLQGYEPVEDMNENRASLEALIRAISRMREKCALSIYTDNEYLYQGFAAKGNIEKWIKNGWQTSRGTEVKNRDKWQALISNLQGNRYVFYLRETNAYTEGLKVDLQQVEEGKITLEGLVKRKGDRNV